jgi:hypothetical protein
MAERSALDACAPPAATGSDVDADARGSLVFTVPFFAARPVTPSESSTAGSSDDHPETSEPRPTKKRKPTYIARKVGPCGDFTRIGNTARCSSML